MLGAGQTDRGEGKNKQERQLPSAGLSAEAVVQRQVMTGLWRLQDWFNLSSWAGSKRDQQWERVAHRDHKVGLPLTIIN